MKLFASEQDADDQTDDTGADDAEDVDTGADEGSEGDEGAEDGADAGQQGDDNVAELAAAREKRRKIEERAAERRREAQNLATDTATAAAQATARETAAAARREAEERREQDAMAAMTDDQRATYLLAKQTRDLQGSVAQTRVLTQSASDQSRFDRLLTRKPQYEKHADEVERRHQQALNAGQHVPREAILAHLIGEMTLKAENVRKQKDAGARRVREARGQGRAARGDSAGGRGGAKSVVQRAEEADWAI